MTSNQKIFLFFYTTIIAMVMSASVPVERNFGYHHHFPTINPQRSHHHLKHFRESSDLHNDFDLDIDDNPLYLESVYIKLKLATTIPGNVTFEVQESYLENAKWIVDGKRVDTIDKFHFNMTNPCSFEARGRKFNPLNIHGSFVISIDNNKVFNVLFKVATLVGTNSLTVESINPAYYSQVTGFSPKGSFDTSILISRTS